MSNPIKFRFAFEVISAILLTYFLHSAIVSTIQHRTSVNVLAFYTQPGAPREAIAWSITMWQSLVAILLFIPATRLYGFGLAFVYFISLILLSWQFPGDPAMFGGLLNYISRFHTMPLAITGTFLIVIGVAFQIYFRNRTLSSSNG